MSQQPAAEAAPETILDFLKAHPAPASAPEVLALKPNTAAEATSGPHAQAATGTITMTKPDGSTFEAQAASREYYESKGFKVAHERKAKE